MKTPKDKAWELVNKFVSLDNDIFCSVNYPYSKQYALITVEEIIESIEFSLINHLDSKYLIEKLNFYDDVKNEIEKL